MEVPRFFGEDYHLPSKNPTFALPRLSGQRQHGQGAVLEMDGHFCHCLSSEAAGPGGPKSQRLDPPPTSGHAPLAAVRSNARGRKRVLYICGASPISPAKGKNKEEPLKDLDHLPHPWLHKKRFQASHHQARILHLERRHANLVAHFADCVRRWA